MADLRDGEVTLALTERMDHRQATGQRRHEVGIAGQCPMRLAGEATMGGAIGGWRTRDSSVMAETPDS